MKSSQEIQKWLNRIDRCEALQSEHTKERHQAISLYTSSFLGKPTNDNTEMSDVNFVYEYVKIMVGAVYAKDPYIFTKTNIFGTHVLLEQARKNKVKKFIHISTDEVYGSVEKGSSKENDSFDDII